VDPATRDVVDAHRLVLVNGRFRTMDPSRPLASAVAIEGGRFVAVGDDLEVLSGNGARAVVDCGGTTFTPGFVDGHCHFEMTCRSSEYELSVQTPPHRSLREVAEVIQRSLDSESGDGWVVCRSSFGMHDKVDEKRLFSRQELDALCPDRPLIVYASLHVASLNTEALNRLGLWEPGTEHPDHGVVHRDADGRPSGVVTEVFLLLPEQSRPHDLGPALVRQARALFSAAGTTTVHTMPESLDQVRIARDLQASGALSVRQRWYVISPAVASLEEIRELAAADVGTDRFRFGGVKVFVNGCAHDGLGHVMDDAKWSQPELDSFVRDVHLAGLQVWLHSLNARGVRMAAEAIGKAYAVQPGDRRHRIEHGGDFLALADLELVRRSQALLVTTPQFLRSMSDTTASSFAPLRAIEAAGVRLVGATDSTGTVPDSVSILGNIATAVSRRGSSGAPVGAEQALSVDAAFRLFTTGSSFGGFEEREKGMIRPGHLADLAQLSADPWQVPPEEIRGIQVQRTYLGGTVVFERDPPPR
jgi:predicted amidohydrolase YtcJ